MDLFVCFFLAICCQRVFVIVVIIVVVTIAVAFRPVEVGVAFVERPSAHDVLAGLVALEVCLLTLAELIYVHGLRETVAGWGCAGSSVDAVWVWWGPGFAGVCVWLFGMSQLWEDFSSRLTINLIVLIH